MDRLLSYNVCLDFRLDVISFLMSHPAQRDDLGVTFMDANTAWKVISKIKG